VGPVILVRSPRNMTVMEGDPVSFDFSAAAGDRFQWQSNSLSAPLTFGNIPGATNPVLTFARTPLSLNGLSFRAGISNATGGVISGSGTLTVVPDTNRPVLLSALLSSDPNQVVVRFSEPVNETTATTQGNYTVTNSSGQLLTITGVSMVDASTVLLTFSAPLAGRNDLRVRNITDTAITPNVITPDSGASVGFEGTLVPFFTSWKYAQPAQDIGDGWMETNFNDSAWATGTTVFDVARNNPRPMVSGEPVGTNLQLTTDSITNRAAFFRTTFAYPTDPATAVLKVRHQVDDGIAIYLNGEEIYRLGIAAGAITWTTFANRTVGTGVSEGPFDLIIPASLLKPGPNLLAAEIRQVNITSSDMTFALELTGFSPSQVITPPPPPSCVPTDPVLNAAMSGSTLTLSWQVAGTCPADTFQLQAATSLAGAQTVWTNVPNGNLSPVNVPVSSSNTATFFRLIKP
jgi:hypothetical protein